LVNAQAANKANARGKKGRPPTRRRRESTPAVSESEGDDKENGIQGLRVDATSDRERVASSTEPSCTGRGRRKKMRKLYDV
jgi:hypothetical protein